MQPHSPSDFNDVNEKLSAEQLISLRVPNKGAFSDSLSYILVIDNIYVTREQKSNGPMMGANGMMHGGGSSEHLLLTGTFVLWDNSNGKIVSFGKINEKTGVFVAMTKNTWITMAQSVSTKIFIGKPYGKSIQREGLR